MEYKKYFATGGILLALIIAFYVGRFSVVRSTDIGVLAGREAGKPADVNFDTFWDVWNILESDYVDRGKLNTQDMVYGAIDGLVNSVGDPYTVFFPPKESEQFQQQISGAFGGVGIEIGLRENILTVIA